MPFILPLAAATQNVSMPWYDLILFPFMWVIGWIMKSVHITLSALGMHSGAGLAWVFSIVGLTIIVRAALIPLFVKQIKAGRAMQMAQPELTALRAKYKGKRDQASQVKMMEEQKAIQKKYGASMSASCLPMLFQMPIFFALYRILYHLHELQNGSFYGHTSIGGMDAQDAKEVLSSHIFSQSMGISFVDPASTSGTKILVSIMVVYLMVTMFVQNKFLTLRNMSDDQLNSDNPMIKSTKYMMYGMPFVYLMSGPMVQIGLLVYWVTNNTWTLVQQYFLVRAYPMRGSRAARGREEAHEKKFVIYREKMEAKLEADSAAVVADPGTMNAKAVEAKIRDLRRQHLRDLAKRRMELGLPDVNLGKVDASEKGGQRMQPGQKGWKEYQEKMLSEDPLLKEEEVQERQEGEKTGADGLTDAQRGAKEAQRRAAERAARNKKNKQARKRK